MTTILSMYEGPLAIFGLNGGETFVLPPENTLEAKRQADRAWAAAEATGALVEGLEGSTNLIETALQPGAPASSIAETSERQFVTPNLRSIVDALPGELSERFSQVADAGGNQLWSYTGSGSVIPIVADANGVVLFGFDTVSQRLVGNFNVPAIAAALAQLVASTNGATALQSYSGSDYLTPLLTDASGKIVMAVDPSGKISADFDLDAFVRKAVSLRADGMASYTGAADLVPLVVDASGAIRLAISRSTGKLSGDFDVAPAIYSWMKSNISPSVSGLYAYTGSTTTRVPIIADQSGKTLMAFNTATERFEFVNSGTSGGGAAYAQAPRVALPQANRFALSSTTTYGVVAYGQSLSLGAQGKPALSTVPPPYLNYTFAAGVRTTLVGNGFLGTNQSDMASAKVLVEDELTGDSNTTRGETILSGMLNGAIELAAIENHLAPTALSFFGSCAGHGGWSIDELKPGYVEPGATVDWYQNFLDHVARQKAVVEAMGRTYVCAAIPWLQLEADAGRDRAWYKSRAAILFARLQDDVVAITGQAVKPHIIAYQTPYGCKAGGAGGPHLALLELAQENMDIHVCPTDGLPFYSDATHMTNVGYLRYGRRLARLLKDIVVDALRPQWINAKSAVVQGNFVRVRFDVPTLPLVLDVDALAPTTGMGFKVISDSGSPNVVDALIENGDTLLLVLDAAPGANPVVRCGLDYLGAGLSITNGATHNLRDSATNSFRKAGETYPGWNAATHFSIPAFTLDAGA